MIHTKFIRVHLAGGVIIELTVPRGTLVVVDAVVTRALAVARRVFALVGDPLVVKIDASAALPGDVALPELPPRAQRDLSSRLDKRRRMW